MTEQTMDMTTARRIFTACLLSAGLGIAVLQMLLLAQVWYMSQRTALTACLASAWMIGSLLGMRIRSAPRLMGGCLLICALLWLAGKPLESWHLVFVPPLMKSMPALLIMALLLGMISTAWLSQQRSWPKAGEGSLLVKGLVSTTAGLFIVWVFPAWAVPIVPLCLIPLLALDSLPVGRSPLPAAEGVAGMWVSRHWNHDQRPVHLEQRPLSWKREWSYIARRQQNAQTFLLLTLLASGVAVILGSLWGTIPTPFAAELASSHTLDKLGWLLAGEFIALIIGAWCLSTARNAIRLSSHSLSVSWYARGMTIAILMPVVMGGSVIALGLPLLQTPWWLMLSLASCTLADAVWSILLPKLKGGNDTTLFPHTLLAGRDLTLKAAQEERFTLRLATGEGILIAALTPLAGWLADLFGSTAIVLLLAGLSLVIIVPFTILALSAIHRIPDLQRTHIFSASAPAFILPPQPERCAVGVVDTGRRFSRRSGWRRGDFAACSPNCARIPLSSDARGMAVPYFGAQWGGG